MGTHRGWTSLGRGLGLGKDHHSTRAPDLSHVPGHGERTAPMGAVEGKAEAESELSLQGRVHPGQGQAV